MTSSTLPVLYIKPSCPWCQEVTAFLNEHGIAHREVDVVTDEAAFKEMQRKSRQTSAPTLDWNGDILADFGVEELVPFLHKHDVELEDS